MMINSIVVIIIFIIKHQRGLHGHYIIPVIAFIRSPIYYLLILLFKEIPTLKSPLLKYLLTFSSSYRLLDIWQHISFQRSTCSKCKTEKNAEARWSSSTWDNFLSALSCTHLYDYSVTRLTWYLRHWLYLSVLLLPQPQSALIWPWPVGCDLSGIWEWKHHTACISSQVYSYITAYNFEIT